MKLLKRDIAPLVPYGWSLGQGRQAEIKRGGSVLGCAQRLPAGVLPQPAVHCTGNGAFGGSGARGWSLASGQSPLGGPSAGIASTTKGQCAVYCVLWAARRSGEPKPLGIRAFINLGARGAFWRLCKGNSGVGVRFPPSRSAQADSVCLCLAQQPPNPGHLGRPQRAQIGRPVSSSFSRHAAFPFQPAVLGCGTDPIRTAQSTRGLV